MQKKYNLLNNYIKYKDYILNIRNIKIVIPMIIGT